MKEVAVFIIPVWCDCLSFERWFLYLLSVDPFETMLKSLLRYQSSLNGDTGESHMRRKLYENGVTKSLQSNFALIQKVRNCLCYCRDALRGSLGKV